MASGQIQASDNFTRANENPLSDGGKWTTLTAYANMQIVSAVAEGTVTGGVSGTYWSGQVWGADQYSEITIANINSGSYILLYLRTNPDPGAASYQLNIANGVSIILYKNVSSVPTQLLVCSPPTVANGDVFRLVASGTLLTVFRNGTSIGSVTDSSVSSGSPGITVLPFGSLGASSLALWNGGSSVEPTPTFSPVSGSYGAPQTVTISDTDTSATITYTTDGSTPVPGSHGTVYTGPITVSSTQTVKAVASITGYTNSLVGSATYTIVPLLLSNAGVAVSAGSTIVNTGNTVLNGDLDLSPGSVVSGFPPGIVTGTQHIDDATAVQSQLDLTTTYTQAASAAGAVTIATALDAVTLNAGVYTSAAGTFALSGGTLTLDGQGNPNAVWIFQMATTLITSGGSTILLTNGASAANVFWQVGSSATIGATNNFVGTILAAASITVTGNGTTITGRLLASAAVNIGDAEVILPGAVTYLISGNAGAPGVLITLTGTSSGTTTSDSLGNYAFTGLVNGTYTVTPTKLGYTFVPVSRSPVINNANQTGVNFTATLTEKPVNPIIGTIFSDRMLSPNTTDMGTGNHQTRIFG